MSRARRYGPPPYRHALVHGGPGAPGMLAPLARELAAEGHGTGIGTGTGIGILEPLQSASSIDGQVEELADTLRDERSGPWTLIGSSWGAMLAVFTAQRHPELIARAVLVGCAPFDPDGGRRTDAARRARMDAAQLEEFERLEIAVGDADPRTASTATATFARIADLLLAVDHVNPTVDHLEVIEHQREVFAAVWAEVEQRRRAGTLLDVGRRLSCPVVVLHGTYDPHPLEGVVEPLRAVAADLRVHVLEGCGHLPWIERDARARFLDVLRDATDPTPGHGSG